jgi:hypothetical protein
MISPIGSGRERAEALIEWTANVRFWLSAQPVDATQALNPVRLGFGSPRSRPTIHQAGQPLS